MIFFDFLNHIYPESDEIYFQKVIAFVNDWESGKKVVTINTSGTTGLPKMIEITREQMVASALLTGKTFGLMPGNHAFCCLNVDFIAGMMMMVRAMELKLQLTVIEPNSNPFLNVHSRKKYDFAAFVPLQLQTIFENPETENYLINHSELNCVIIGGSGINNALLAKIEHVKIPFFLTYGMTETVSHVAIRQLNGHQKTEYFEALKGIDLKVDERNCLVIKGECTNNQWIFTNDIVELLAENKFYLKGRANRIVNSGGIKLYLDILEKEIEKEVSDYFGHQVNFFLFPVPDEKLGEKLGLLIRAENPKFNTSAKDIFKYSTLIKYKIPKNIYFLSDFVLTSSGKIDYQKTINNLKI